jgi:hypothetical protein
VALGKLHPLVGTWNQANEFEIIESAVSTIEQLKAIAQSPQQLEVYRAERVGLEVLRKIADTNSQYYLAAGFSEYLVVKQMAIDAVATIDKADKGE